MWKAEEEGQWGASVGYIGRQSQKERKEKTELTVDLDVEYT